VEAFPVNEVVGVAGFVVAGTHVDVLVSGTSPEASRGNITRTLLQNLSVLSAGQDFKKDAEGKPVTVQVVNLLLTPQQAEMLSLASVQMTLQLVLRNPMDAVITTPPGVTLSSMLFGQSPPVTRSLPVAHPVTVKQTPVVLALAVTPPTPEPLRMEIIEGSKRTEVRLQKVEIR
jgi:pilus assembly protein CpaB